MRFLDRNHYCINYSQRCNYGCSYCINNASVDAPYSVVEKNPSAIVKVFNTVDPGVIMVSGGEPLLWADMPHLIDALPQHYWVILTNLSMLPDWLRHKNVRLVVCAYHKEFTVPAHFFKRLRGLPRAIVKIIVEPGMEHEHIPFWSKCWVNGVPAHLVPIEWPRGFSDKFIACLTSGKYLTSSMYNSRFFSGPVERPRLCIAGTRDMFQIGPGGKMGRCSQSGGIQGSVFDPVFNDVVTQCSDSCYCEWHHWSEMTLANDNDVWNHYIETGVWKIPTISGFRNFVEKMGWKGVNGGKGTCNGG